MIRIDDINDMATLRAEIDAVDRELISLLTRRQALIYRAAKIKIAEGLPADIPWRVEEVVSNARRNASENGLDPDLIGSIWRQLVEAAIKLEIRQMDENNG